MSYIVTRRNRAGVVFVLCFNLREGTFWANLREREQDDWREVRQFATLDGAALCAQTNEGTAEERDAASASNLPGSLQPQAT